MSPPESPFAPQGWKAGAAALAAFQAKHHGVAKGGKVDGGPRRGSKYATLLDILAVCAKGSEQGLSHSCQARLVGENLLVWREVLHHSSGEFIFTEHPIPIPDKGLPGQRQQDLGGCITYARKYCLQALYGLYADDGLDPDEVSYDNAEAAAPVKNVPVQEAAESLSKAFSGSAPVVLPESEQPKVESNQRDLVKAEKDLALSIIKDPHRGDEWKAEFKKKFYPSAQKLTGGMVSTLEHLQFLEALQLQAPF